MKKRKKTEKKIKVKKIYISKKRIIFLKFCAFQSRIVETDRQDRSFRKFKLIKWWAQSFLGNEQGFLSTLWIRIHMYPFHFGLPDPDPDSK